MSSISQISLWDFVDPSKPWVFGDGKAAFEGFANVIPKHFRYGPWHIGSRFALGLLFGTLIVSATWMVLNKPSNVVEGGGWLSLFRIADDQYQGFTTAWYVNLATFLWMMFVCWRIMFVSPTGKAAWITFTLWSWTTVTVRNGWLVLSPWIPFVRLIAEILRFPGLLSATITTSVWNLLLFPAVVLFFSKDHEQRMQRIRYFTSFWLTQLHVFKLLFAT